MKFPLSPPPHVLSSSSFTAVPSQRSPPRRRRASARDARRAAQDEEDRPKSAGDMEGGIEVCSAPPAPRAPRCAAADARRAAGQVVVDESPFPRVRAMRCNMAPETVVKETSEGTIMTRLKKDLEGWIKSQ